MKPCRGCPFNRAVQPGELGGSPIVTYLGQSAGPFLLHCHAAKGYSPDASRANPNLQQCAGAAIYRANTGVAPFLPKSLLRLPEDKDSVFSSPEEFVAHHGRVPVAIAERFLSEHPVSEHVARQCERSTNTYHFTPA
jgi:hypothetical protein